MRPRLRPTSTFHQAANEDELRDRTLNPPESDTLRIHFMVKRDSRVPQSIPSGANWPRALLDNAVLLAAGGRILLPVVERLLIDKGKTGASPRRKGTGPTWSAGPPNR